MRDIDILNSRFFSGLIRKIVQANIIYISQILLNMSLFVSTFHKIGVNYIILSSPSCDINNQSIK